MWPKRIKQKAKYPSENHNYLIGKAKKSFKTIQNLSIIDQICIKKKVFKYQSHMIFHMIFHSPYIKTNTKIWLYHGI